MTDLLPFENVKVVKPGIFSITPTERKVASTCTLIKSDKIIVVDTGSFGEQEKVNTTVSMDRNSRGQNTLQYC